MAYLPSDDNLLIKSHMTTAILAKGGLSSFDRLCLAIGEERAKANRPAPLQKAQPAAKPAPAPAKKPAAYGVPVESRQANLPHLKRQAQGHLDKCMKAMKQNGVPAHNIASIQVFCQHKLESGEIAPEDLMKLLDDCVKGSATGKHLDDLNDGKVHLAQFGAM